MEAFIEHHRPQLQGSGVPPHYWPVLYDKLVNQTFDAGNVLTHICGAITFNFNSLSMLQFFDQKLF